MIPAWLTRTLDRCESCSLDNQADRERLVSTMLEEIGLESFPSLIGALRLHTKETDEMRAALHDAHSALMWIANFNGDIRHDAMPSHTTIQSLVERLGRIANRAP